MNRVAILLCACIALLPVPAHAQISFDGGGTGGGAVITGASTSACDATTDGGLRWSTGNSCIEFCNGTTWQCLQGTVCANSLPNTFSFTNQTNVAVSTVTTSNIVQITGITGCEVEVSITGQGTPQYQLCSDSTCTTVVQGWTSAKTAISNNEYLQLRLTSSSSGNITFTTAVTVGAGVVGWSVATTGDCTDPSPPVGTFCADGTVYAGITPDGGTKMYTTPCRHGETWDGTTCTGTSTLPLWSQTNTINTGVTGFNTGEGSTTALAGLSNADSPYSAASLCDGLVFGGQSDWYIPAEGEAQIIVSGCDLIPFNSCAASTRVWTSTETGSAQARYWQPNGAFSQSTKLTSTYRLRCVRKD